MYKILCEELYNGKGDENLFSHAILTMGWNSMARSNNSVNMHVQHIQWISDSFIYSFANSKGNQTGDRDNDPCHVYSNPNKPTICPVINMAKYFLSHPDSLTTNSKLFP